MERGCEVEAVDNYPYHHVLIAHGGAHHTMSILVPCS